MKKIELKFYGSAETLSTEVIHGLRSELGQLGRVGVSVRKEVIQPQVLLQLPCYDFTPVMSHTVGTGFPEGFPLATSSTAHFRDVTGGVYKARERIHRGMLIHDY